jgi:outer membrane murein-binding lipoprotein Lpp
MMIRTNGNKGWLEVNTKLAVIVSALTVVAVTWAVASNIILAGADIRQTKMKCEQFEKADKELTAKVDKLAGEQELQARSDSVYRADVVKRLERIERKLDNW